MTIQQKGLLSASMKVLLPILVIFLIIFGALSFIKSNVTSGQRAENAIELTPGNILPSFVLTQIDGRPINISSINAKVIIVNFWASWCEACMEEMPSLVQLHKIYRKEGLEILGIDLDEDPELTTPEIVKQFGIEFPIFKDPDNKVADLFDVHAIPMTVILNRQLKILYVKNGSLDWNSQSIHDEIKRWLNE